MAISCRVADDLDLGSAIDAGQDLLDPAKHRVLDEILGLAVQQSPRCSTGLLTAENTEERRGLWLP